METRGSIGALRRRRPASTRSGRPRRRRTSTGCCWRRSCSACPSTKMRVIAPDVGGGFGCKIFLYSDMAADALGWRKKLGRPGQVHRGPLGELPAPRPTAATTSPTSRSARPSDGTITALQGQDLRQPRRLPLDDRAGHPDDAVRPDDRRLSTRSRHPLRGHRRLHQHRDGRRLPRRRPAGGDLPDRAGRAICFADAIGIDPAEVRRKNFIQPSDFPYDTGIGMLPYDSGNYEPALDKALEIVGYQDFRQEQAARRASGDGKLLGIGLSLLRRGLRRRAVEVDRPARRGLGRRPVGERQRPGPPDRQGRRHHRLAAARPGPRDDLRADRRRRAGRARTTTSMVEHSRHRRHAVRLRHLRQPPAGGRRHGDLQERRPRSRRRPRSWPRTCSRPTPEDIVCEDGKAFVKGSPDQAKTIAARSRSRPHVAYDLPEGMEPFLDETTYYDPPNCTFPFGTHICVVEVDARPARSTCKRYVAVDDVGNVINPLIVDGQVHGGIAQGIAQALYEGAVYDEQRPAAHRHADGLRDPEGEHGADLRARPHRDAVARSTRWASRAPARPARSPRPRRWSTR